MQEITTLSVTTGAGEIHMLYTLKEENLMNAFFLLEGLMNLGMQFTRNV